MHNTKFQRVNTPLISKFRGSIPCAGQIWRGWLSVLAHQRCANYASLGALAMNRLLQHGHSCALQIAITINSCLSYIVTKERKPQTMSKLLFHQLNQPPWLDHPLSYPQPTRGQGWENACRRWPGWSIVQQIFSCQSLCISIICSITAQISRRHLIKSGSSSLAAST